MPVLLSERMPLPSLRCYTLLSLVFLVSGFLHSMNAIEDRSTTLGEELENRGPGHENELSFFGNVSGYFSGKSSFYAWSVINMAFCGLVMVGKLIQKFVFGNLRLAEEQHLQEKFWNFVFYKVIFVFGVINTQKLNEVMHWLAWFSMVGFWKIFGQICTDRFDNIISSPNSYKKRHTRLLCLLVFILISTISMAAAAYHSEFAKNWSIFGFMLADCVLLGFESLHMIIRHILHFVEDADDENWEKKSVIVYHVDLIFQSIIHGIDLLHHLHMLLWSNVFLSMASLVLYWNIRTIFSDLKQKVKKYKICRKVTQNIQEKFELLGENDLIGYEDNCAICWDQMKNARKLPCGHMFHQFCLLSWLQQDTSCPTCRVSLANVIDLPERQPVNHLIDGEIDQRQFVDLQAQGNQRNHFFHFDGTRIANWFPSFSIEVFHGANETSEPELEQMAIEVHSMFPAIPFNAILDDIRRTQSPETTAENILEGNVVFGNSQTDDDELRTQENGMNGVDEQLSLLNVENQELTAASTTTSSAPSESESSDAGSCAEFHESAEKRQNSFHSRRQRMFSDSRKRFTNKGVEQYGSNINEQPIQSQSSSSTRKRDLPNQEERRARVLEAVERRLRTDEEQ